MLNLKLQIQVKRTLFSPSEKIDLSQFNASDDVNFNFNKRLHRFFVAYVQKQHVASCINCRMRKHHFRECRLAYWPGSCQICGAEAFDTTDCIYPHGIEHKQALGRCPGCSRDINRYFTEFLDCNVRHKGLVDWLSLNYATWPTWLFPTDQQYLVCQGD